MSWYSCFVFDGCYIYIKYYLLSKCWFHVAHILLNLFFVKHLSLVVNVWVEEHDVCILTHLLYTNLNYGSVFWLLCARYLYKQLHTDVKYMFVIICTPSMLIIRVNWLISTLLYTIKKILYLLVYRIRVRILFQTNILADPDIF